MRRRLFILAGFLALGLSAPATAGEVRWIDHARRVFDETEALEPDECVLVEAQRAGAGRGPPEQDDREVVFWWRAGAA